MREFDSGFAKDFYMETDKIFMDNIKPV